MVDGSYVFGSFLHVDGDDVGPAGASQSILRTLGPTIQIVLYVDDEGSELRQSKEEKLGRQTTIEEQSSVNRNEDAELFITTSQAQEFNAAVANQLELLPRIDLVDSFPSPYQCFSKRPPFNTVMEERL